MKSFLSLVLLTFFCFSACKQKQEDILTDIKKKAEEIDGSLKKYTKRQVDDLTSLTGGNITGYYRDEEVKKVYAQHFGEKGRTFTDYYFDDGMLIFIYRQEYIYNKPLYYTEELARSNNDSDWYDDKKTQLQVSRFYFHKNKLIKWIDGADSGNDVAVNKPDFTTKESSLWAETVILLKQLKED